MTAAELPPDPGMVGMYEAIAHSHRRQAAIDALLAWIAAQGSEDYPSAESYTAALQMLQDRNTDLANAWARGYTEGLRTP